MTLVKRLRWGLVSDREPSGGEWGIAMGIATHMEAIGLEGDEAAGG